MPEQAEPVVSVRNIPQSQYQAQQGAPMGGGIQGHLQRNWPMYALGIGLLTIVVMIYLNYRNSVGNTTSTDTSSTGSVTDWGAQLDSDYQQSISNENAIIGLLQQQQNGSKTTTTPPTTSSVPAPIIQSQWPSTGSFNANDVHGPASWQSTQEFTKINTGAIKPATSGSVAHFIYPENRLQGR